MASPIDESTACEGSHTVGARAEDRGGKGPEEGVPAPLEGGWQGFWEEMGTSEG